MFPTKNISSMPAADALEALGVINQDMPYTSYNADDMERVMKDALSHPDEGVVVRALEIIPHTNERARFIEDINQHAMFGNPIEIRKEALRAMQDYLPSQFPEFLHTLKQGFKDPFAEISFLAFQVLQYMCSSIPKVTKEYEDALEDASFSPHDKVIGEAFANIFRFCGLSRQIEIAERAAQNRADQMRMRLMFKRMWDAHAEKDIAKFIPTLEHILVHGDYDTKVIVFNSMRRAAVIKGQLPSSVINFVKNALSYRDDDGIMKNVISVVGELTDKSPFERELIRYAGDHTNPEVAANALEAINGTSDFTPYEGVIMKAIESNDSQLWWGAFGAYKVSDLKRGDPVIAKLLKKGVLVGDEDLARCFVDNIEWFPDRVQFIASLNAARNKWQGTASVVETIASALNRIFRQIDRKKSPIEGSPIRARLDFSASADPQKLADAHSHDVPHLVRQAFDEATVGNLILAKARVTYSNKREVSDNSILDVVLIPQEVGKIEHFIGTGISPECDLTRCEDGSFRVRVTENIPLF